MRYKNRLLDWKCPLCGGDVEMQACATVCLECDVSLDPDTHIPFKHDSGKVVKAHEFGGGQVP